jgi:hypothetical protein
MSAKAKTIWQVVPANWEAAKYTYEEDEPTLFENKRDALAYAAEMARLMSPGEYKVAELTLR